MLIFPKLPDVVEGGSHAGIFYKCKNGEINWKINASKTYLPQPSDPKVINLAIAPKDKLIIFGTQNPY
ncbi:unnamed protein product [Rhizophagus irregularis]|nr:unnamed protein product [Rhizophagus irregularis]CAB4429962.1 unnamed protein product [Rhizophagus irregularis]